MTSVYSLASSAATEAFKSSCRGYPDGREVESVRGRESGRMAPDGTFDGAQEWVDNWAQEATDTIEGVQRIAGVVAGVTASACSDRGEVEATVGASGQLIDLKLWDELRHWSMPDLADEIVRVSTKARDRLGDAAAEAARREGVDTEQAQMIAESYYGSTQGASQ